MNKFIPVCVFFFLCATLFTGCEKCSTCSYTVTLLGSDTTYTEDYCGSKKEIEEFESSWQEAAANSGVPVGCIKE